MKKYIKGYGKSYEIYSDGGVFSLKSNKFLKQHNTTSGYLKVCLSHKGIVKQCMTHRIVAKHFFNNPEDKAQVNHIDGNKHNNDVSNLEWCTRGENMSHSINVLNNPKPPLNFLDKFGSDHNRSKKVRVIMPDGILREFGSGLEFQRETGLDHSSISYARCNKLINGVSEYKFVGGKMKGIILLSNDI